MKVPFHSLDPHLQEVLVYFSQQEFGCDKHGIFVAPTETKPRMALFIAVGTLLAAGSVFLILDPKSKGPWLLLWFFQSAGFAVILYYWYRWYELNQSTLKPAFIITPLLAVTTGLEDESVEMFYLRDASGSSIFEHRQRGIYCGSTLVFYFPETQIKIFEYFKANAAQVIDFFEHARRHIKSLPITEEKYPSLNWLALPLHPSPLVEKKHTWVWLVMTSLFLSSVFTWCAYVYKAH